MSTSVFPDFRLSTDPRALLAAGLLTLAGTAQSAPAGLTAEQVYDILVAEIATQRGEPATALRHYLHAAGTADSPRLAELALRAAIAANDDTGAGQALRRWLELDPNALPAHQSAAYLRLRNGDRAGALAALARIVALAGADLERGYTQVVAVLARIPDPALRLTFMRELADRFPSQAEAQQTLALVAAGAGQPALADQAARRALALRPDWNQPRLFLVKRLLAEDQRGPAQALLETFLEQQPEDPALRLLYGQLLVESEDFASARAQYERLLSAQPRAPEVLFALGILSLQLDDRDGARRYFTRLYETGARRDEASFYLGQTEERDGQPEAALHWYGRVSGANATDAQVRMALLWARTGEVQRARAQLQRLRDQSPDQAVALFLAEAEILDEIGQPDAAAAVYDLALEGHADNLELRYARALHAVEHNRIAAAEQDLRLIIAADPDYVDAINALGYTLADRTDRFAEARVLIERALALKPDEPAILDSMGWVLYRLGHREQALEYLRRALTLLNDGEIAAHLGEVLWALERRDEAWAVWETALRDHPEHPYLLEVVARHRALAPGATARNGALPAH